MKRLSETRLLLIGVVVSFCSIIIFILHYFMPWHITLEDWADIATYFGLSMSIISIVLIYLTYRSQVNMSAVLQFESSFFQWYQIHIGLYSELMEDIDDFAKNEVEKFFTSKLYFKISDFKNHENTIETRDVVRYYRSLYSMMKYIYLSDVLTTYESKKKYYDIIQSRMTDNELLVILYLLLSDKNLESTRVLSITYKDLLDEAHFFKNLYYSKENKNFDAFVLFMRKLFPKTAEKSFHFLVLDDSSNNQETEINFDVIYKEWEHVENLFYSRFNYFILFFAFFFGIGVKEILDKDNVIHHFSTTLIICGIFILFCMLYLLHRGKIHLDKILEYKNNINELTKKLQIKNEYTNKLIGYYIPIFCIIVLLILLIGLI